MTFMDKINAALVRYLREVRNIEAVDAHFGDTEDGMGGGCDTCGQGADEMSFEIIYRMSDKSQWKWIELDGDPLQFLPTLLDYDTEE